MRTQWEPTLAFLDRVFRMTSLRLSGHHPVTRAGTLVQAPPAALARPTRAEPAGAARPTRGCAAQGWFQFCVVNLILYES